MRLTATKRWLLYALLVWLGGLGCLAGCVAQTHAAAMPEPHAAGGSHEESCTDGCCKKKNGSEHAPDSQHSTEQSCCIYLNIPAATVAKSSLNAAPPAVTPLILEQSSDSTPDASTFHREQSRGPDSCPTHLRNRVLRI